MDKLQMSVTISKNTVDGQALCNCKKLGENKKEDGRC